MKSLYKALLVISWFASSHLEAANLAVVMSAKSSVEKLSRRQVKKLFLGKSKKLPSGGVATVLDHQNSYAAREAFYKDVIGKHGSKLETYWSKLKFTGKGQPPKQVESVTELVTALTNDQNAISYLKKEDITGDLKIVFEK